MEPSSHIVVKVMPARCFSQLKEVNDMKGLPQ